jgi:hypothetical protein
MTRTRLTRRNLLIAGSAVLATPYLSSRPARADGQVVIRNPGGAWSDTQKKYIYEPFTTETGIEVVIVPTTLTKMLAMVKSGKSGSRPSARMRYIAHPPVNSELGAANRPSFRNNETVRSLCAFDVTAVAKVWKIGAIGAVSLTL